MLVELLINSLGRLARATYDTDAKRAAKAAREAAKAARAEAERLGFPCNEVGDTLHTKEDKEDE